MLDLGERLLQASREERLSQLGAELQYAILSFERSTYYPLSKPELVKDPVILADAIRDMLNDLGLVDGLEEHGQKWRNKIEVFFHHWVQKEELESKGVCDHLLGSLKILSGNNAEQQISTHQCRSVLRHSKELKKAWGGNNSNFRHQDLVFEHIKSLSNGGSIFLCKDFTDGRSCENYFFFPHIDDFDIVVRGALNTHELGLSGVVPGALSCLSVFLYHRFGEERNKRDVYIQGLYRTNGPFPLEHSQFQCLRRYHDHQIELAEIFLESCEDKGVTEIKLGSNLIGGNRNLYYLWAARNKGNYDYRIMSEERELKLLKTC